LSPNQEVSSSRKNFIHIIIRKSVKKEITKLAGVFLIAVGLISTAIHPEVTGLSISDNHWFPLKSAWLIFSLASIISGVLILTNSRDMLQKRLEEMENESPSPSLQKAKNKKQTDKERAYFSKREKSQRETLLNLIKRKIGISTGRIEKAENNNYFSEGSDYQKIDGWKIGEYEKNAATKESKRERELEKIEDARKGLNNSNGERYNSVEDLHALSEFYKKHGIPFREKERAARELRLSNKHFDESIRNRHGSLTPVRLSSIVESLNAHLRNTGSKGRKVYEEALREYADNADTVSIDSFSSKYGQKVIVGIPTRIEKSLRNNLQAQKEALYHANSGGEIGFSFYLNKIIQKKPMLSASSIDISSDRNKFYYHSGIILKEGRIFDAAPTDAGSKSENSVKLAIRHQNADIEDRAGEAARSARISNGEYNELIVGDYSIEGIYFNREAMEKGASGRYSLSPEKAEQEIKNLANISLKHNLPLYEFAQGRGFVKVNPSDYLIENSRKPVIKKSRKPRTLAHS